MTREDALTVATMLATAYPRDMGEPTLEAYAKHLVDLDRETATHAVYALIRTSKWLPTIAEIRQHEARARLPAPLTADEAFAQAVSLMASIGSYGRLETQGHPYVRRTLGLLGRWADLCVEPTHLLRKRFLGAYARVVEQAEHAVAQGHPVDWLEGERRDTPAITQGQAAGMLTRIVSAARERRAPS